MLSPSGEEVGRRPTDEAARKRAAVETYARHEKALRRTARRFSICADDADDALQRALEILLTKAPTVDPRELIRWTQTVVKHEALAVRRDRERILSGPAAVTPEPGREDWVALTPTDADCPPERAERREAVARSREALRTLKPQELRALGLLAEGYSYKEIGELTGFSHTKVNRCLAEGRERFRKAIAGGEDGSRCEEMRPLLSAFCDGEANPGDDTEALREHLRACGACRATLRAYRAAPGAVAALAPALPLARSLLERVHDALAGVARQLDRFGADPVLSPAASGGGAGLAGAVKVAAVCLGAAGGTAACVGAGVVPGPAQLAGENAVAPVIERRIDPAIGAEETDLRSGIGGDSAALGLLAEGTHTVRTVSVSGSGMRSTGSSATVRVDATVPSVDLDPPRGWVDHPVLVFARAADSLSGMTAAGPSGPQTGIAVDGAAPRLEPGPAVRAPVVGEGRHEVTAFARDAAGNVGREAGPVAEVRIDESAPTIAFARTQDPAEPERIEAVALDPLSGVEPLGASIALRAAGSRARFQPLPTTFARGRLIARWDSDSFPPGSYEFRAVARDLAGNWASSERRGNGARMVLANPLKLTTLLRADLVPAHGSKPLPYGRRPTYGGRLYSVAGAPLAGLPVEVVESFGAGASVEARGTVVRTRADGSFETRLATGPSRGVWARFAGSRTLSRSLAAPTRLAVSAGIWMRASARVAAIGGAPVIFSGRVARTGASLQAGRRSVALQFRLPGRRWSEFRTVQCDRHGRFRYAYSFSDDDSRGVRFRFRAFVAAQEGWPYEPAGSKPVFVTGR
jgi:RNA polymerase sigma factor (sigma-70 family)